MWSGGRSIEVVQVSFRLRPTESSQTTSPPSLRLFSFPFFFAMPPLKRPNPTTTSDGKSHKRTRLQQGRQITSKQHPSSSSRPLSSPVVGKGNDAALRGESVSSLHGRPAIPLLTHIFLVSLQAWLVFLNRLRSRSLLSFVSSFLPFVRAHPLAFVNLANLLLNRLVPSRFSR